MDESLPSVNVTEPVALEQTHNRNGKIVTFYSYKGGTGRSMTLANVAWVLASSGKKVLAIDWDLEAPGLQRYFYPFLIDKELSFSEGLINFVDDYKAKALTPPAKDEDVPADWYVKYADIREYAVSLARKFPSDGSIDFVPAGRQDDTYSNLVNQFNWGDFYERLGGNRFLEAAAAIMRRHYDYILIDSRTGVSDTSGICTVKLPDALVACFTLNYQGINGAAAVADYVYSRRVLGASNDVSSSQRSVAGPSQSSRPKFDIFPVPMRLEDAQTRKLERRRKYARDRKFARYPTYLYKGEREDYWANVPIKYYSFYAYEEILAAFGEEQKDVTSLLASIERLTAYLTDGQVAEPLLVPQPDRDAILKEFEGDTYEPVAPVEKPNQAVYHAFANLKSDQQEVAQSIILRLVRVAGANDAEHTRQFANLTEFDGQALPVIQMLRNFQVLTIQNDKNTGEDVVQLHPGLQLPEWDLLRKWIEGDKDFLRWRQMLRDQANKWKGSRGNEELLLRGPGLNLAKMRLTERSNDLFSIEKEFIEASVLREERERRYEEQLKLDLEIQEQLAKSRALEESERKRKEQTRSKRAKVVAAASPPETHLRPKSAIVKAAREILRGQSVEPREMLRLAKKLKEENVFGMARRILARARVEPSLNDDPALRLEIFHQSAVCTYKDPDLPADARLDRALQILLASSEDIDTTNNQETLGITGAIYKRKWELDNQKQQLERSLNYYRRGYAQGPANDLGYTGINAAFVLDLLAQQEEEEAKKARVVSELANQRRAEARDIRSDIVRQVAPLIDQPDTDWLQGKWWFYATVAEAYFGMGEYERSISWLDRGQVEAKALSGGVPAWEYESTARQLASLARLQDNSLVNPGLPTSLEQAFAALRRFFTEQEVQSVFLGKTGLALSGGGFRASLFHIGVLARLAELDVLRSVEVLSCVSGGSIIGAHYYLELRKLLQSVSDGDITRQHYIDIVAKVRRDFLSGVQSNVRVRIAAEYLTNVKMTFLPGYSRTKRAGELFERDIFSRVEDSESTQLGETGRPRWLSGLYIAPLGIDGTPAEDFIPKVGNWRRRAKVPSLILNATSLNTGHNWQFTASWMGESPSRIDSEIDGNEYLRRLYYDEEDTPKTYRRFRLGDAVAASACVPGLFEPLSLDELYPHRSVRLVDGGVCDNQGVGSLLEQDCDVILASDGSGQMESQDRPSSGPLSVPLRSNNILQARVREAQYHELNARKRAGLLRGFMFVHLKEDLDVDPVDWIGCLDPSDARDDSRPAYRRGPLTRYGIAKDVQKLLAGVRTDLDSFTDIEAFALMTSAYRMTEHEFKYANSIQGYPEPSEQYAWDFLAVEEGMKGSGPKYEYLKKQLSVSDNIAFKIWKLSWPLKISAFISTLAVTVLLVWTYPSWGGITLIRATLGGIVLMFLGFLFVWFVLRVIGARVTRAGQSETLISVATGLVMTCVGFLLARIHLHVFDPMFLRSGSIEALRGQSE